MGCCKFIDQILFHLIVWDVAEHVPPLLHNPFKETFALAGCLLTQLSQKQNQKNHCHKV